MPLSKEAIREFKEIYKKEFGKEISGQEAYNNTSIKQICLSGVSQ